jgi:hypothetical protein
MRKSDYDAPHANKLLMACGKCPSCIKKKAKVWAIRMENEAKMHDQNCFITITFDDEHLPKHNTLRLEDPQKFLKRLRKHIAKTDSQKKIKNFYCGEYGTQRGRAHYHLCIFGWMPSDMVLFAQLKTGNLYTSQVLSDLWPYGHSTVSEFTPANAQYTANYVLKDDGLDSLTDYQCIDEETGQTIQRLPPFQRMSLRPALGFEFFEKYKDDLRAYLEIRLLKLFEEIPFEELKPFFIKEKLHTKLGAVKDPISIDLPREEEFFMLPTMGLIPLVGKKEDYMKIYVNYGMKIYQLGGSRGTSSKKTSLRRFSVKGGRYRVLQYKGKRQSKANRR